ncbi:MAG: thiamine pyrophosphate-dependent enzyme, partial [Promethearchaeota archaeon]
HFIHAARRNLDITALIINNQIYGMTGGQVSPTTPFELVTSSSPFGNLEPPFDICELAKGLELVRKEGILVALMTSEDSAVVKARAKKLQIKHIFMGVKDKLGKLEQLCKDFKIKMSEIAYIGDDLNDLSCIENVGLGACPADALGDVKKAAKYICQNEGGKGAVREFCEILLKIHKTIP